MSSTSGGEVEFRADWTMCSRVVEELWLRPQSAGTQILLAIPKFIGQVNHITSAINAAIRSMQFFVVH